MKEFPKDYYEFLTYLWIIEYSFSIVYTPSISVRCLPCSRHAAFTPRLLQGEKRCVHHTADRHVGEELAEIFKCHPVKQKRSKNIQLKTVKSHTYSLCIVATTFVVRGLNLGYISIYGLHRQAV